MTFKTFRAGLALVGILLLLVALIVGALSEREPYVDEKTPVATELPTEPPTEFPTPTQEVFMKTVMVNVGTANVRNGPTTDSEVVDTVHYGEVIHVIAEFDGWYQFDEGWIKASLTVDK